jgi:hypothetical protein
VFEAEVVAEDSGDEFSHLLDSHDDAEGEKEGEREGNRGPRIVAGTVLYCTVV